MATVVKKVKLPAENESECDKIVKNALKNYPYALNLFGETNFCRSGDIACGDCACADFCANCGDAGDKGDFCDNALILTKRAAANTEIGFVCYGKAEIKTEVTGFFPEEKNKKLATEIAKSVKNEIENYCRERLLKKVKNARKTR